MPKKTFADSNIRPASKLQTAAKHLLQHHQQFGEQFAEYLPEPTTIKTVEQLADFVNDFYNNVYYCASSPKNKRGSDSKRTVRN